MIEFSRKVYFIEAVGAGQIKIGVAHNPKRRLEAFQCSSPVPLKIRKVIPGDHLVESALHQKFAYLRTNGEWFRAAEELLAFIESDECNAFPHETELSRRRLFRAYERFLAKAAKESEPIPESRVTLLGRLPYLSLVPLFIDVGRRAVFLGDATRAELCSRILGPIAHD